MPTPGSNYKFEWSLQSKDSIDHGYHAKKYKTIMNEYITDKRANKISDSHRKQECKWFTEIYQ